MTVAAKTRLAPILRWPVERLLIVAIALLWLLLIAPFPRSLNGTGVLVVLALLALDLAMGVRTRWLAFIPTWKLDERQTALRDQAYRTAFRWMRIAIVLMLVLAVVRSAIYSLVSSGPEGVAARFVLALLEMLLLMPTVVLGWEQSAGRPHLGQPSIGRRQWLVLLVVPLAALGWAAAAPVLPNREVLARPTSTSFDMTGATCSQFLVEKEVAWSLAGAVGLHAEVCWNGQKAFAVGDPTDFPLPAGVLPEQQVLPAGPFIPNLTACSPGDAETDFGRVFETCREEIAADGSLTLTAHGAASPLPGDLLAHNLSVRLVISHDGKVLFAG